MKRHCRKSLREKKLRPSTFPSFLEQFWIIGDKLPNTNGVLMEVLSNLPCVHSLSTILGHDSEELGLEVFIGDGWTAGAFDLRFTSRFSRQRSQFAFQRGDDFAGIREFELQFVDGFLIQSLHLFLEGFDLFLEGGFLFGCSRCHMINVFKAVFIASQEVLPPNIMYLLVSLRHTSTCSTNRGLPRIT